MCFEAVLEEIRLSLQRVTWFIIVRNMIAMILAELFPSFWTYVSKL